MKPPKVSIVVLNWNGKEDTIECVKSLQLINYSNYEIIIIDNGSTDESVATFYKQFPGIKIIQNQKNLGFAGGNNVGIQKALADAAEYILLLNNDTIVDMDFLIELVNVAESDPLIGVIGPKIYSYYHSHKIISSGKKFNLWTGNFSLSFREIEDNDIVEFKEVGYIDGCCMLINSKIIKNVGCLDSDYFLYWEETDWCYRILNSGFKIIYAPKSKILHKISASSGSDLSLYYYNRNIFLFIKKNGTEANIIFFLLFFITIKFWIQLIVLFLFHRKSSRFLSFLRGTRDGINILLDY